MRRRGEVRGEVIKGGAGFLEGRGDFLKRRGDILSDGGVNGVERRQ